MKILALLFLLSAMALSHPAVAKQTGRQSPFPARAQADADTVSNAVEKIYFRKSSLGKKPRDRIAKLSLVLDGLALVSILFNIGVAFLLGLAGIAAGIASLVRIKNGKSPAAARTAARLGVSLGVVVTALVVIVFAYLIVIID